MSNDYNQPDYGSASGMPGFGMPGAGAMPYSMPAAAPRGRGRRDKGPTRRSAARMRLLFLGFAGILGLLAVLAITGSAQVTYVARLSTDRPALAQLTPPDVEIVAFRDATAIEPDTFSGASVDAVRNDVDAYLEGKWLSQSAAKGQQLRTTMLSASGVLSSPLAPDERLVSIGARASRAVAGTLRVGDRVDVFVADSEGLSGVLGQAVEVVAISIQPDSFDSAAAQQLTEPDKSLDDYVPTEPIPGTYVLRIKATDVTKYIAADSAGTIYLALRGEGAEDAVVLPADLIEAICAGPDASTSPTCDRRFFAAESVDPGAPAAEEPAPQG